MAFRGFGRENPNKEIKESGLGNEQTQITGKEQGKRQLVYAYDAARIEWYNWVEQGVKNYLESGQGWTKEAARDHILKTELTEEQRKLYHEGEELQPRQN